MMQQRSSGSIKKNLLLAVIIMGCLVLAGVIFSFSVLPLRFNTGLVQGMEVIKNDPTVAEMFGSPIRQGLVVMGTLQKFRYGDGVGNLSTSIAGPKGKGEAGFYVTKPEGSNWKLVSMSIHVGRELVLVWDTNQSELGFRYYQSPPSDVPIQPAAPTSVP